MGDNVLEAGGFEVVSAAELHELFLQQNDLFGSHSDESVVTTEDDVFSSDCPPRDAVEEWPDSGQVYSFYFVRHRTYDDPEIKAKIEQADNEIYNCNLARIQITNELKAKRAERSGLFAQLEILESERDAFNAILDEKKKELEPLQEALGKLRSSDGGHLCSSEKELDDLVYSLQYRVQQETISLMEEKQLLKEIKQLEGTREKVRAYSVMRAKIQDSLGEKEAIQGQVKSMGVNLNEVKKARQEVISKINCLSEKLRVIKMEMELLDVELTGVYDRRDKAFETIKTLRRQRDQGDARFFQSRAVLTKARELAANGCVKNLEELANAEVEKFMSLWNSDKAFRDDYEKRILPSLDTRRLSRDGRIRNPEEELLVASEAPAERGKRGVTRACAKWGREDAGSSSSQDSNVVTYKAKKESGKKVKDFIKCSSEESDGIDFDIPRYERPQKEQEIDEAKLKEKKREEELEKARQAMERKRRLQEKAAAKAAIRAQKEAEKKLKEREKKAKKKAAASSSPSDREETPETVTEVSEPEKAETKASSSTSAKEKPEKEISVPPRQRSFRYRHRARGAEALPKAIMKRRRASNYWLWAVPSVAVALVLLVVTYFYVH